MENLTALYGERESADEYITDAAPVKTTLFLGRGKWNSSKILYKRKQILCDSARFKQHYYFEKDTDIQ